MYHNSNEIYQFDKDRRKYYRYDEETEKSIKNKNGRKGRLQKCPPILPLSYIS